MIIPPFSALYMIDHNVLMQSDMIKSCQASLITKLLLVENSFSGLVLGQ